MANQTAFTPSAQTIDLELRYVQKFITDLITGDATNRNDLWHMKVNTAHTTQWYDISNEVNYIIINARPAVTSDVFNVGDDTIDLTLKAIACYSSLRESHRQYQKENFTEKDTYIINNQGKLEYTNKKPFLLQEYIGDLVANKPSVIEEAFKQTLTDDPKKHGYSEPSILLGVLKELQQHGVNPKAFFEDLHKHDTNWNLEIADNLFENVIIRLNKLGIEPAPKSVFPKALNEKINELSGDSKFAGLKYDLSGVSPHAHRMDAIENNRPEDLAHPYKEKKVEPKAHHATHSEQSTSMMGSLMRALKGLSFARD